MQRLVIRNFGPISEAEIEIKNTVVLIGEQASGKSTIAKLIYYFKSLREDLFNKTYNESLNEGFEFDYLNYLIVPSREKFYDFFGSTKHLRNFDIRFYFSVEDDKYLNISLTKEKKLYPQFSEQFNLGELSNQIRFLRNLIKILSDENDDFAVLAYNQDKLKYAERLSTLLKETFCCDQDDNLFVVAGRNATVGYSDSFERQFLLSTHGKSYQKKSQTIDETLMLDFMDKVLRNKDLFRKFNDFETYLNMYDKDKRKELQIVLDKISKILKGKYQIDSYGEKIVFNSKKSEYVYLSNSSSGQQEVIRILQDIFLNIADKKRVFRIVEEPEAHLFPLAQKLVVELLVQMAQHSQSNQLIITTHSPYVLTVLNNMLFAQRVITNNPGSEEEVNKIIGNECLIKSDDFSAYVLDNDGNEFMTKSIVDLNTGMIAQNYLDTISEVLSNEFNSLYKIHSTSFKNG